MKDWRRIAPRSPRAALEPEQVKMPMRQFKRTHSPFFTIISALFTVILLLGIAGGVGYVVAKQRFDAAGPLAEEKIVIIPRSSGIRDIADLLEAQGVIDQPWLFVAGAVAMKARE